MQTRYDVFLVKWGLLFQHFNIKLIDQMTGHEVSVHKVANHQRFAWEAQWGARGSSICTLLPFLIELNLNFIQ